MRHKPIFRRRRADEDIEAAITFYLDEAGAEVASDFISQLEEVVKRISKQPGAGSQRFGQELSIPGLRQWPMRRFPYLIFYIERAGRIEIARVLHTSVDIPSWLERDNT